MMSGPTLDDPYARTGQIYPVMPAEMIARVRSYGAEEKVPAGTTLFARGDRHADFFLVVAGEIGIFHSGEADDEERLLTVHRHGQFTGELDHVSARALLVTARALTAARVVRVSSADVRKLLSGEPDVGEMVMRELKLLDKVGGDLRRGHYPNAGQGAKVAAILRKVADDLDA